MNERAQERCRISGGGLREAGYPNAPQSKMLGGKTVVLPPDFSIPYRLGLATMNNFLKQTGAVSH